jgi:hypothetical protein
MPHTRVPSVLLTNDDIVDDGTGVADCLHCYRPAKPPSETSKYKSIDSKTPLEPFNPITEIGRTVRVTGIVRTQYHTRVIFINEISASSAGSPRRHSNIFLDQCSSPNEEFLHSRLVQELHRTNYSSKEPFVIPKRPEKSTSDSPIKFTLNPSVTIQDSPTTVSSSPVKSSQFKSHETSAISFVSLPAQVLDFDLEPEQVSVCTETPPPFQITHQGSH